MDVSYDILSRDHLDRYKPFKATFQLNYYFENNNNNNILIPRVGLRFLKDGTYVIESNFYIKVKKDRDISMLYLNYIHNKTIYTQHNQAATSLDEINNKEFK